MQKGQIVVLHLNVDDEPLSLTRLEFVGLCGENNWLHFIDVKTKENHLCPPDQFPTFEIKSYEKKIRYFYERQN
jgi:hypothetical protein